MVLLAGAALACSAARPETAPPAAPPGAVRPDLHLHVSMDSAAKPVFKGRSGDSHVAGAPGVILRNQVDVDTLAHSGVRLALGAVWPPFRLRPGLDERGEALRQLQGLRDFARQSRGFAVAADSQSARRLLAAGYVTVIPAVEGGEGLRTPEDVDALFAAGGRAVTLVHFIDNDVGGAAKGQLGRALGLRAETLNDRGLSDVGRAVVKRMIELGIIIDLAHASDRTMREVLDITEPLGVPVINSHAAARTFSPMERNVSDELLARIAKGGGVVGVTLYSGFTAGVPQSAHVPGHSPDTCDDIVSHWRHFASQVGAQNVLLGSDFNGFVTRPAPGGACPDGLRHTGDLPHLFAALEKAGIPSAAIDGGGERLLQLWEQVEARSSGEARAQAARRSLPRPDLFGSPL